jgi:hypothetical protein
MSDHKRNPFGLHTLVRRPVRIKDLYGRPLEVGDEVLLHRLGPPQYVVQDVVPDLSPGAPPNTVRVVLLSTASFSVPADVPVANLLRVRSAGERGIEGPPVTSDNGDGGGDNDPPLDHEPKTN